MKYIKYPLTEQTRVGANRVENSDNTVRWTAASPTIRRSVWSAIFIFLWTNLVQTPEKEADAGLKLKVMRPDFPVAQTCLIGLNTTDKNTLSSHAQPRYSWQSRL